MIVGRLSGPTLSSLRAFLFVMLGERIDDVGRACAILDPPRASLRGRSCRGCRGIGIRSRARRACELLRRGTRCDSMRAMSACVIRPGQPRVGSLHAT